MRQGSEIGLIDEGHIRYLSNASSLDSMLVEFVSEFKFLVTYTTIKFILVKRRKVRKNGIVMVV